MQRMHSSVHTYSLQDTGSAVLPHLSSHNTCELNPVLNVFCFYFTDFLVTLSLVLAVCSILYSLKSMWWYISVSLTSVQVYAPHVGISLLFVFLRMISLQSKHVFILMINLFLLLFAASLITGNTFRFCLFSFLVHLSSHAGNWPSTRRSVSCLCPSLGVARLCIFLWNTHKGLNDMSAESDHSEYLTARFYEAVNCQLQCHWGFIMSPCAKMGFNSRL